MKTVAVLAVQEKIKKYVYSLAMLNIKFKKAPNLGAFHLYSLTYYITILISTAILKNHTIIIYDTELTYTDLHLKSHAKYFVW